ncbi:MAG: DUF2027 domain-containing protein [Flavobacteriales bacterium]|nr:DUF2027 domain-containing protein [Flavobacteriales bacterium]
MLEIGEKVRFLDDVGQGIIIKFIDAKTALVEDEWGLTFPHPISKLVPAERDRVAERPVVVDPQIVKPKTTLIPMVKGTKAEQLPELALAFVSANREKPETGDLDLLFVNNSNYHLLINVAAKENEEWFSLFHSEIVPNSEKLVQSLRRQDVGSVGNLNVDVLFFGTTGYENRKPISCSLKIKATRFVRTGNYLLYEGIENPALAIPIENEKVVVAPTFQPTRNFKQVEKPSLPTLEEEVDLHLEAILGTDPSDMPDHEKFLTQMHHFEQRLNHALTHKYVQITFIHGVGTGRLKEAIRKELTEYNLPFEDGAFHKYGVGATVVRLH